VTSARYATAHVDELDRLAAFGEHGVWRPVRHHFGIEAFGINAYTADQAGRRVVEEHDELGEAGVGRHQELYVVLSGRAAFTVDGNDFEAPAGTFVFLGDPAVRRGAVALEAGTTVLAIGGRPGQPYAVSPWEYSFRGLARRGCEGAAIFEEGAARYPENPSLPFNLACMHALDGDREAALEALRGAIAVDSKVRDWAAGDEDLTSLRGDERFEKLLAS
jgi:mannose-6-phosphate isomerase-like protein (cupin superfamily)